MDFEQFVAQYQKRTAKRMADFEALMRSLGVEDSDLGEDNPKEG